MIGATLSDLGLLVPELILVGMASALILAARRIQRAPVAVVGTVLAALAATLVAVWDLSVGTRTGFGGTIILDGYSQFFKVLIGVTLALAALLSVKSIDRDQVPHGRVPCPTLVGLDGNDARSFSSGFPGRCTWAWSS